MQAENIIFIVVLLVSIILHELTHGYAADALGDPTPELAGRLSLNPLVHIDWIGSVIVPLFLIISGAPFLFGWAKPVPFNPNNLNNKKWGSLMVALAGPLSNLVFAGLFALILHFFTFSVFITSFFSSIVLINIALALFNLVPIPPLDGYHILSGLLGNKFSGIKLFLERYSFILLVAFIVFGWKFLSPIVMYVSSLLL